jgi:hypothetical protein
MTNVYGSKEKVSRKNRLFEIGIEALEKRGYKIERMHGAGKSSLRKITKDGKSKLVSIRTTQDTWIAFPRDKSNKYWVTLSEVDAVVAVSVDDPHDPKFANVHLIDGSEMRSRFDSAYVARLKAGHKIPVGRGVWVSLYTPESNAPPAHVGAGAGLKHPPFATVPLEQSVFAAKDEEVADEAVHSDDAPLTIAEAKRRLALTFGVDPSNIKITVEA